jgi:hypothetical protein
MVSLRNKAKQTKIFNLPHSYVCADGKCLCSRAEFRSETHNPRSGERGVRVLDRQICASVHLLPGQWSEALPDSVLLVPEVKAAIEARRCESKTVQAAPSTPTAPPVSESEPPAPPADAPPAPESAGE